MTTLSGRRKTYDEFLWLALESYYLECRIERGRNTANGDLSKSLDIILGELEDHIAHEFKHPIEKLMWHCFMLIVGLGLNTKADEYHSEQAKTIIQDLGVENIMKYLSSDEIVEVDATLRKLGLLE